MRRFALQSGFHDTIPTGFAVAPTLHYLLKYDMTNLKALVCDGCGQEASAEHIARRLRRLEWTTRYRPVHVNTLVLGAFSPQEEKDFLYAPGGEFHGEAAHLLDALGISVVGKAADAVHAEFQRAGFFLTHLLECPLNSDAGQGAAAAALLARRLQPVARRIRRSLKPKRVVLISQALGPILDELLALELGCPVVLDDGKLFEFDGPAPGKSVARLRGALAGPAADWPIGQAPGGH
ncbi:MAG: hypothetical protein JWN63_2853 [Candidatus Acidoferrum typicum]|nr:hypothetical protein [Candidatus Acidoferrum typicum]